MNDRLISTGNVAEVLDVSEATIKRWADAGALPCIRTPGGHRKFRLRDVAMYKARLARVNSSYPVSDADDGTMEEVVSAMLVGDADKILELIAIMRKIGQSMASIVDVTLQPALEQVKQAYAAGRCEEFQLQVAINSLVEVTILQKPIVRGVRLGRGNVVAAPFPWETDDVCARFGALVAEEAGFDVLLLGADLAPASLSRASENMAASWILLFGTVVSNNDLVDCVEKLLERLTKSQSKVMCVCAGTQPSANTIDDALFVADYREAERLLSPLPKLSKSPDRSTQLLHADRAEDELRCGIDQECDEV